MGEGTWTPNTHPGYAYACVLTAHSRWSQKSKSVSRAANKRAVTMLQDQLTPRNVGIYADALCDITTVIC